MKNVIILILAVAVLAEGYMLWMKKPAPVAAGTQSQLAPQPSVAPTARPQVMLTKGMKLQESPVGKFAYKIVPDMTDEAKKALVGFDVKTEVLTNGSIQVFLTPKDTDDQRQEYVVKPGYSLYFIEMTAVDDHGDQDKDSNYRDDYGIITDKDGVVQ